MVPEIDGIRIGNLHVVRIQLHSQREQSFAVRFLHIPRVEGAIRHHTVIYAQRVLRGRCRLGLEVNGVFPCLQQSVDRVNHVCRDDYGGYFCRRHVHEKHHRATWSRDTMLRGAVTDEVLCGVAAVYVHVNPCAVFHLSVDGCDAVQVALSAVFPVRVIHADPRHDDKRNDSTARVVLHGLRVIRLMRTSLQKHITGRIS